MRLALPRRLGDRVFVAGALILLLSLGLALAVRSLQRTTDLARRSSDVIGLARETERLVLDVETGQRGFLIPGHEVFLEPWRSARRDLPPTLARTLIFGGDGEDPEAFDELLVRSEIGADREEAQAAVGSAG